MDQEQFFNYIRENRDVLFKLDGNGTIKYLKKDQRNNNVVKEFIQNNLFVKPNYENMYFDQRRQVFVNEENKIQTPLLVNIEKLMRYAMMTDFEELKEICRFSLYELLQDKSDSEVDIILGLEK